MKPNHSFLVYCPTNKGETKINFNDSRLFDIALNDYTGTGKGMEIADYQFKEKGHKWPCINKNLKKIEKSYEFIAFLDNDIEITTEEINNLFLIGKEHNLSLFQPALTLDSQCDHEQFYRKENSYIRETEMVEIMMPFFSREGLEKCKNTFSLSESGWGLDLVWPKILKNDNLAIIDTIQAKHENKPSSYGWQMSNGLTPKEEMEKLIERFENY